MASFEEPQQFALNRLERELFGGDGREAVRHFEAHLHGKESAGGGIAPDPVDAFVHNFSEYVVVRFHYFLLMSRSRYRRGSISVGFQFFLSCFTEPELWYLPPFASSLFSICPGSKKI